MSSARTGAGGPARVLLWPALAALVAGMPLLGAWMEGRPLGPYLQFPPLTRAHGTAGFHWAYFAGVLAAGAALLAPPLLRVLGSPAPARASGAGRFPAWGWAGAALAVLSWTLAWTRFSWFAPLQSFTFSPIWLGYTVTVNALTVQRAGRCMLTHRPRLFLGLFPLSAAFWWSFEYLNRFVGNWYYVGVADFDPGAYVLFASLSFATVLPAVLCTRDWLATFPRLSAGLDAWIRVRPPRPRLLAAVTLAAGAAGLAGIAAWPAYLFPLVWVAPLLLIVALQVLAGTGTAFDALARGDWRGPWCGALAALACGFFWEMWNYGSLAHWEYAVPWVGRFHLFEMPALGYLGYLPFGLTCIAAENFFLSRGGITMPATPGGEDGPDSAARTSGEGGG